MPNPTTYASAKQQIGLAVEVTQGTAVPPVITMPLEKFDPSDQSTWLDDKSLFGSMTEPRARVQGVKHAEFDMAGPAYLDTIGYLLSNIMGDVVYSGTYTGTGTTTLSAGTSIGATSILTVGVLTGGTLIQIDTGVSSEVRLITTVTGAGPYTVNFTAPLVLAHLSAAVVRPITFPYSSAFSLLNSGSAQPSSLTITDYQGPTVTTGTRAYRGCCLSELALKGTVESSSLDFTAKGMAWPSASAAAFVAAPSTVTAPPAWQAQIGLTGTVAAQPILTVAEYGITLTRELEMIYTGRNSQDPYFIQRGKLTAGGTLTAVVNDETFLTYLNSNTQPQLQLILTNGLAGASLLAIQVDIQKAAFNDSKIQRGKAAVEYAANYTALASTTLAGASGGFSPVLLTVQNAITPGSY